MNKDYTDSEINQIIELNEIYYAISKEIIEYRKNNKLTQKDLAKRTKVNQTMISKLESGNYNPTFKQIYNLSRKLTNSKEIFIKILKEIIADLDNITNAVFTDEIKNEYTISNIYENTNKKNNILYLKEYSNKGEEEYGECKSKNAIFG